MRRVYRITLQWSGIGAPLGERKAVPATVLDQEKR
jgi:hypothetical protein